MQVGKTLTEEGGKSGARLGSRAQSDLQKLCRSRLLPVAPSSASPVRVSIQMLLSSSLALHLLHVVFAAHVNVGALLPYEI